MSYNRILYHMSTYISHYMLTYNATQPNGRVIHELARRAHGQGQRSAAVLSLLRCPRKHLPGLRLYMHARMRIQAHTHAYAQRKIRWFPLLLPLPLASSTIHPHTRTCTLPSLRGRYLSLDVYAKCDFYHPAASYLRQTNLKSDVAC